MLGFHRQWQLRASTMKHSKKSQYLRVRTESLERHSTSNHRPRDEHPQTFKKLSLRFWVESTHSWEGLSWVSLSATQRSKTGNGNANGRRGWTLILHACVNVIFLSVGVSQSSVQCRHPWASKKSFRVLQVCFPSQIEPLNSNQTTPAEPQPPKKMDWGQKQTPRNIKR